MVSMVFGISAALLLQLPVFAGDPSPAAQPSPAPSFAPAAGSPTGLSPGLSDRSVHSPNYHLVGWLNTFIPGSGQLLLGRPFFALTQATLEIGSFSWGYSMSKLSPLSLDGVPESLPVFGRAQTRRQGANQADLEKPLYADLLQEFGIKYHMVNTFEAYRDAAANDPEASSRIDQSSTLDLFVAPFKLSNWSDPWVFAPIAAVALYAVGDYFFSRNSNPRDQRLTPYSNFLYSFNYGAWQPIGSGAPEEMFFRGFLENELYAVVPSPYFAVPLSALAFSLAHGPGTGRLTAGVAGAYLGALAYREKFQLAKGITVHYWADLLLGIDTILQSQTAQRGTPPSAFYIQVGY